MSKNIDFLSYVCAEQENDLNSLFRKLVLYGTQSSGGGVSAICRLIIPDRQINQVLGPYSNGGVWPEDIEKWYSYSNEERHGKVNEKTRLSGGDAEQKLLSAIRQFITDKYHTNDPYKEHGNEGPYERGIFLNNGKVMILVSRGPCVYCKNQIEFFHKEHPNIKIYIRYKQETKIANYGGVICGYESATQVSDMFWQKEI